MDDILDLIDQATGCQQCGGLLGESPSDDFCGQSCQELWAASRSQPLESYRESGHDFWGDEVRFNGPPSRDYGLMQVMPSVFDDGARRGMEYVRHRYPRLYDWANRQSMRRWWEVDLTDPNLSDTEIITNWRPLPGPLLEVTYAAAEPCTDFATPSMTATVMPVRRVIMVHTAEGRRRIPEMVIDECGGLTYNRSDPDLGQSLADQINAAAERVKARCTPVPRQVTTWSSGPGEVRIYDGTEWHTIGYTDSVDIAFSGPSVPVGEDPERG